MKEHKKEWLNIYHFICELCVPFSVVAALVFLITALSYDPFSYAASFSLKETVLANTASPRLIIVGGSGAAAGIDSKKLGKLTGLAPVNMGVYAGSGMRLVINDVTPHLKRGDVVLLAPEYEMFQQPSYGDGSHLLQILHANPSKIADIITPHGSVVMTRAFPNVLQQETARLMQKLRMRDNRSEKSLSEKLYSIRNITSTGDLDTTVANGYQLGLDKILQEGRGFVRESIESENLELIKNLLKNAASVGATVYVVLPAVPASVSEDNMPAVAAQYKQLASAIGQKSIIGQPGYFIFPDEQFLDSIGHLTFAGRMERTQRIADVLITLPR